MSLLSQIGAAVRAAFAFVTTVVRRCARTGRLIFETVRDAPRSFGATPQADYSAAAERAVPMPPEHVQSESRWDGVRRLAVALAAGKETMSDYKGVAERDASWLSVLSRQNLCRIVSASDQALDDHVSGRRIMRGICAADPESVAAMLNAIAMEEMQDAQRLLVDGDEPLEGRDMPRMAAA